MAHPDIDQYYFDCAQAIIKGENTKKIPRPSSMDNLVVPNEVIPVPKPRKSIEDLYLERRINNPHNEPTGDHTGRCSKCGSTDLWDDNLAYGCNNCHAILRGNDPPMFIVFPSSYNE